MISAQISVRKNQWEYYSSPILFGNQLKFYIVSFFILIYYLIYFLNYFLILLLILWPIRNVKNSFLLFFIFGTHNILIANNLKNLTVTLFCAFWYLEVIISSVKNEDSYGC